MEKSLQLKISLAGIKPLIWRRVVVDPELSLFEFASVINCVMPWSGNHLAKFITREHHYTTPFVGYENSDDAESVDKFLNSTVGDLLSEVDDFLKYEYDPTDRWIHNISVEKISAPLEDMPAKYMTGKNMAPPEECGGVDGYKDIVEVMSDANHPRFAEVNKWLMIDEDEEFDPSFIGCEAEDINDMLMIMLNEDFE